MCEPIPSSAGTGPFMSRSISRECFAEFPKKIVRRKGVGGWVFKLSWLRLVVKTMWCCLRRGGILLVSVPSTFPFIRSHSLTRWHSRRPSRHAYNPSGRQVPVQVTSAYPRCLWGPALAWFEPRAPSLVELVQREFIPLQQKNTIGLHLYGHQ